MRFRNLMGIFHEGERVKALRQLRGKIKVGNMRRVMNQKDSLNNQENLRLHIRHRMSSESNLPVGCFLGQTKKKTKEIEENQVFIIASFISPD